MLESKYHAPDTGAAISTQQSDAASKGPVVTVEDLAARFNLKKQIVKGKAEYNGANPEGNGATKDGFWLRADGSGYDRNGTNYTQPEVAKLAGISPSDYAPCVEYRARTSPNKPTGKPETTEAPQPIKSPEARGIAPQTLGSFAVSRIKSEKFDGWKYPTHHANGAEGRTRFKNAQGKPKYQWWKGGDGRQPDAYNLQNIPDDAPEVWAVGGEPDVWMMHQNGFPSVAAFGETQGAARLVSALVEKRAGCLHIALDNDRAGHEGAAALAEECERQGLACTIRQFQGADGHDVCDEFTRTGCDRKRFRAAILALPEVDHATIASWKETPTTTPPAPDAAPREKKSQAENLLEIALREAEIFLDKDGEPFATIKTKSGARLTYRLNSTTFRSWIFARHYAIHDRMVSSSSTFAVVLDTLRGSLMEKTAREVYTRIAHHQGRIIYDLGDESGRAIEITPNGWTVCAAPPVAFIRPKGMRPQVEPQRGGSAAELRELLNVETDEDFVLVLAFILGFFQPEGAKSHLAFLGEQGTAKTATTKTIREILDPNDAPTRSEPREIGDLIVAAKNNAIIGFDNLSHIPQWVSDTFCRFATGSGDGKRKLYVDDEEVIFAFKRSIIFNAITDVATRPDLLDRTILIELPVLPESKRRREGSLDHDFTQSRPLILGAIFDAVATGLGRFSTLEIKNLPRMADFAVWVEACGPGLGWEEEEFLNIYRQNRDSTTDSAAEISTLASFIIELWAAKRQEPFEGSPHELLELLNRAAKPNYAMGEATNIREAKDWPKDAANLGRSLKRFAPILRAKGIHIESGKSKSRRVWRIAAREAN